MPIMDSMLLFVVMAGVHDAEIDAVKSSIELAERHIVESRKNASWSEEFAIEVWRLDGERIGSALGTFTVVVNLDTGELLPEYESETWTFEMGKAPDRRLKTASLPGQPHLFRITSHSSMRMAKEEARAWHGNQARRRAQGLGYPGQEKASV